LPFSIAARRFFSLVETPPFLPIATRCSLSFGVSVLGILFVGVCGFDSVHGSDFSSHPVLLHLGKILAEDAAVDRPFGIALSGSRVETALVSKFNFAVAHRDDLLPMQAHFLRLKRSGELGSFAAAGWSFI